MDKEINELNVSFWERIRLLRRNKKAKLQQLGYIQTELEDE